jgi:hypothetical protein
MPITVLWDDPEQRTTVLWVFEGVWSWADFAAAEQNAILMCQGITYPLDHIVDMSALKLSPTDLLARGRSIYSEKTDFEAGLTVLVGANRFIESVVSIFKQVTPQRFKNYQLAASLDSARELIRRFHAETRVEQ